MSVAVQYVMALLLFLCRSSEGILSEDGKYSSYCDGRINHAVNIVGYGTDEETGLDYWIARNSWGRAWGMDGYFYIQRGINLCYIESYAAIVIVP